MGSPIETTTNKPSSPYRYPPELIESLKQSRIDNGRRLTEIIDKAGIAASAITASDSWAVDIKDLKRIRFGFAIELTMLGLPTRDAMEKIGMLKDNKPHI